MANVFKNYLNPITTDFDFFCPTGATLTVIGLTLTNKSGGLLTARIRSSNPGSQVEILYNSIIMPGSSVILAGGDQKIILDGTGIENPGRLIFSSSPSYNMDVTISYMLTT